MGGGTYSRVLPEGITFGPGFPNIKKHGADFLPDGHGGLHGTDKALHIPSLLEAIKIYPMTTHSNTPIFFKVGVKSGYVPG